MYIFIVYKSFSFTVLNWSGLPQCHDDLAMKRLMQQLLLYDEENLWQLFNLLSIIKNTSLHILSLW
jgi:hypothetical protein